MALFKFGKSTDAAAGSEGGSARSRRRQAADSQETLEAIRRRALNRLLGAALLVAVAVIGLPMLFDKQPRLVPVDAPISIPDKGDVAPLQVSSVETLGEREEFVPSEGKVGAASTPALEAPSQLAAPEPASGAAKAAADAREKERREQQQVKAEKERQQQAKLKAEKERQQQAAKVKAEKERKEQQAKAEKERQQQAKLKAEKERQQQQQAAAKAKAEQERKEQQAKAEKERQQQQAKAKAEQERKEQQTKAAQRFFIPLGSFPDAQTAHQTRMKAERAGVHTYIQIVQTSAGERTRVRAGPYNSRQEADKAAAVLKGAGIPATVQPF